MFYILSTKMNLVCCFLFCLVFLLVKSQNVTDDEINAIVQQLLTADSNRARSNHLTVNYQQYSNSKIKSDASREK